MFIVGSKENFIVVDFIENSGSLPYIDIYRNYEIPAGSKVKVELKFKDGYIDSYRHEKVPIYNSTSEGPYDHYGQPDEIQYLVDEFWHSSSKGNYTFSSETIEFISKGWVFIKGMTLYNNSNNPTHWYEDAQPYVYIDYLKISYSIQ